MLFKYIQSCDSEYFTILDVQEVFQIHHMYTVRFFPFYIVTKIWTYCQRIEGSNKIYSLC